VSLDRWAKRIYTERDFGRSVATSVSGVVGLVVYLVFEDWVIAVFSAVIAFPIVRIISSAVHSAHTRKKLVVEDRQQAQELYERLSEEEKGVLREFVKAGGSVMSWSHANRVNLHEPGVATLMQREILYSTMTPDGMREAFAVRVDIFDAAQKAYDEETDF
jgi:ABC-type multidrug transport system fused ATPase/permease subunit